MATAHKPVDPQLFDHLHVLSAMGTHCDVYYENEKGQELAAHGAIDDVFKSNGHSYIRMSSGEVVSLDQITKVDVLPYTGNPLGSLDSRQDI